MVQSEVREKTFNRNVILNDLFFYTFFPLLKFKWKWSSWPRWIKMQRTWVGLGGIGVFIQTYLKGNRTLNKPRKQHRIHFLKPAFLFFKYYWQGDQKDKVPYAWDFPSIFSVLVVSFKIFCLLRKGSVLPVWSKGTAKMTTQWLLPSLAPALPGLHCPSGRATGLEPSVCLLQTPEGRGAPHPLCSSLIIPASHSQVPCLVSSSHSWYLPRSMQFW